MNKNLYIELLFLIFLGAITSLSLPPFNYWIVNFFTFTLLFYILFKKIYIKKNKISYFLYGWSFGFGYFISNLYWVSISLTFDSSFNYLIPFSIFLLPAFFGIFYGLISFFFIIAKSNKIISSFLFFSLIFGILEFVRGFLFTGFPWNLIVYSLSNQLEFLSILSITGTYGLNLLCISLFTSPALLLFRYSKKNISLLAFFIFLHFFFYIHGIFYEDKFNSAEKIKYDYKVRVLASNIGIDRFFTNIDTVSVINDLIELSEPNKNEKTIFVWPEGILPDVSQKELIEYDWLFNEKFSENHLLILGINSQSYQNGHENYFNSLSLYDYKLNLLKSYNKIKLVPFGEFLPFKEFLSRIGLRAITNQHHSFSKGKKREIIEIKKNNFSIRILPLICYEIIYSGKIFDDNNFDLIINISEDGWFGDSIGPRQHFAHSIFRAIESGKYIIRSSNNGITAIINPLGNIEQIVDFGKSGYIDYNENKKIQPTVFSIYGNKIFGFLILLYIFFIFSFNRFKNE